jgi:hypothetical protein
MVFQKRGERFTLSVGRGPGRGRSSKQIVPKIRVSSVAKHFLRCLRALRATLFAKTIRAENFFH